MDKISYAIGLSMGQNLLGSGVTSLEYADLAAGSKDVLEKTNHKFLTKKLNKCSVSSSAN